MRATKVKGIRGDRGSDEKVGRDREKKTERGKLDSWPTGGIRPGARVCDFPCVRSPPHSLLPPISLNSIAILHS